MALLAERIKTALTRSGLSQAELGRAAGVTRGAVHQWLNGQTKKLDSSVAWAAAKALDVDPEWLATGKGVIGNYRNHKKRDTTHSKPAQYLPEFNLREPDSRYVGRVPLISAVQAGQWMEVNDPFEPGDAEDWLICPEKHAENTFALKVAGDSMTSPHPGQKSYPAGVYIYVDPPGS